MQNTQYKCENQKGVAWVINNGAVAAQISGVGAQKLRNRPQWAPELLIIPFAHPNSAIHNEMGKPGYSFIYINQFVELIYIPPPKHVWIASLSLLETPTPFIQSCVWPGLELRGSNGQFSLTECPRHRHFQPLVQYVVYNPSSSSYVPWLTDLCTQRIGKNKGCTCQV